MADVKVSDVISTLETYKFNPAAMQRVALDVLKAVTNNEINIVDATNPYVHCLETTAFNCSAFMIQNEATTRRLYPAAATNMEDLYLHMSDKDYAHQHAEPSKAIFKIMLNKNELLSKMILDINTGIKSIRIPRNSVFYASDIPFSLQYPIDIKQPAHGGIQVSYVVDQISPLKTLSTNAIDWIELKTPDNESFIQFEVEVDQFFVEQRTNDVSNVSGFTTTIPLTDYFYHLRCYVQNSDNSYSEINVTHTAQVYDPFVITAVIKVFEASVEVTIPSIYTKTNMITGKLRLDVYQTKGPLSVSLGSYRAEDFRADWINLDENDDTEYTTPITNFRSLVIYSTSDVNGGSPSPTFLEMKSKVIRNTSNANNTPITNVQLEDNLSSNGYEIIKDIDSVTNRIYWASRALPKPIDDAIFTAASAAVSKVQLTLKEATNIYGAFDNNKRITLSSKVVYQNKNGITRPLTNIEFDALDNLPILQKCVDVTNGNYFFSPYTYVLDATEDTFESRAYFIDNPIIKTKSFVAENATTGFQVSIDSSYSVSKNDTGYVVDIVTKSSSNFKALDDSNVQVILAFYPQNQSDRVYIAGVLKGKTTTNERLYSFDLNSSYDIDKDDYIVITNTNGSASAVDIKGPLDIHYDIFFCTTATKAVGWTYSSLDDDIINFDLPDDAYAITNERLNVVLGYRLEGLWSQSRSNATFAPYRVYTTDVAAYYKRDVYEVDPITGAAFTIDGGGNLVYNILHHAGDPVLDTEGNPVLEHLVGEIVLDEYGNPEIMPGYERDLLRFVDILTIEAAYYFAIPQDYNTSTNYRTVIVKSLNSWILEDIPGFNERLLDKTKIYFYPKVAIGDIEILTNNNEIATVSASQSFKAILLVPPVVYKDSTLLQALRAITIKTIDKSLQNSTVSISSMEKDLLDTYGSDVISVELSGLGGVNTHNTFTVTNNSHRCSIRKRLSTLPNNTLIVEDDVTIEFVEHGKA
jgi:hypothetical protein